MQSLTRQRPREHSQSRMESRSFPPSTVGYSMRLRGAVSSSDSGQDEEDSFFERPPPPPPPLPPPPSSQQSQQTQIDQATNGLVKDEEVSGKIADILSSTQDREADISEDLVE